MRYYITGHRDLSKEEFNRIYLPKIDDIIREDSNAVFLVGACEGVDLYTRQYLIKYNIRLQIYGPYFESDHINNITQVHFLVSYENAANKMIENSDITIGFIKPGRESSFTALNILKRYIINKS
jgi:hypothetical protein